MIVIVTMSKCILKFDGASKFNPGPSGTGYEIVVGGEQVETGGRSLGKATCNEAEYTALIDGLEALKRLGIQSAEVYGDSALVCNQISGIWKVKKQNLIGLWKRAVELKNELGVKKIEHIPRSENAVADCLASNYAIACK